MKKGGKRIRPNPEPIDITGVSRFVLIISYGHSCATLMIHNGSPMNNVSEWVGHSETTTTMKFYAHLDDRSKQYSAELMESALKLPEGGNPPSWK